MRKRARCPFAYDADADAFVCTSAGTEGVPNVVVGSKVYVWCEVKVEGRWKEDKYEALVKSIDGANDKLSVYYEAEQMTQVVDLVNIHSVISSPHARATRARTALARAAQSQGDGGGGGGGGAVGKRLSREEKGKAPMEATVQAGASHTVQTGDALRVHSSAVHQRLRSGQVKPDSEKVEADHVKRRRMLVDALARGGLTLRSDSKLCKQYIDCGDVPGFTLEGIVRRMAEMKWLYQYTGYKQLQKKYFEEMIRGARAAADYGYDYGYGDYDYGYDYGYGGYDSSDSTEEYYRSVGERAREKAERRVLRRKGGWPTHWPWLHWTRKTHAAFPPTFRAQARALLLSLPRALGVSASAASPLSERVVAHLALLNHAHV